MVTEHIRHMGNLHIIRTTLKQLETLAQDLAEHLDIQTCIADPVADRFSAVGYPRDAHLTDFYRIWKIASDRTRLIEVVLVTAILAYWTSRFLQSYQANAEPYEAIRTLVNHLSAMT